MFSLSFAKIPNSVMFLISVLIIWSFLYSFKIFSQGFLIIGSVSSVIWILYGIMKPDYVILTTDSIILFIQSYSFYITWKYKKKKLKIDDEIQEEIPTATDVIAEEVI